MPVKPDLLVRGLDGRPLPPTDLLERIRRYDKRLGLFYTRAAWAITEAWREGDSRYEWVQNGSVQPEMAFDICGYLPATCSLEEALPYIERELRKYSAEEHKALRYSVSHWNDAGMGAVIEDKVRSEMSDDLDRTDL